jgi:hypothetical protein
MMLGDILAAVRRSEGGIERWLGEAEPDLAARLDEAAAAEGETARSFVRIAVADFSRFAGEDDWATLVSRLRDDADPGTTCLALMLEWRLAAAPAPRAAASTEEGKRR